MPRSQPPCICTDLAGELGAAKTTEQTLVATDLLTFLPECHS